MTPSKALPVPFTLVGLLRTVIGSGLVMDRPFTLTAIASQMPPLLLPSSRDNVTSSVPLTGRLLRTCTNALTSCSPPPLISVVGELADQLSRLTTRASVTCVALSFQGSCPALT